MRWALVTCAGDMVGGVFAKSFKAAGGPPPDAIYLLPSRPSLDFPGWAKPFVALRMLGVGGVWRLGTASRLRPFMRAADRSAGLGEDFVEHMRRQGTAMATCGNAAELRERLMALQPDLLVSVGAPIVFGAALLEIPRLGAVNVHNGRLPRYRGHFGTFWEVLEGEEASATVLHRMAKKVDTGAILDSAAVSLETVPGFLDLLMEKKRLGGAMLAGLLTSIMTTGVLPQGTPMSGATGPHYHFPSVREALRFRWPQLRRPRT